ncbi:Uncharacterised protein [Vibrio cholerae]|nr:Uncharacterised protein [Vibrio cholerae]
MNRRVLITVTCWRTWRCTKLALISLGSLVISPITQRLGHYWRSIIGSKAMHFLTMTLL